MDESNPSKISQLIHNKIILIGVGIAVLITISLIGIKIFNTYQNSKNSVVDLTAPVPVRKSDVLIKKDSPPYQKGIITIRYKEGYSYENLVHENKKKEILEIDKTLKDAGVIDQKKEYADVKGALENYYLLTLKPGADMVEVQKILQESPYIDFAQPHYEYKAFVMPNDPSYSQQTDLQGIFMPQAWDIATGSDVAVAVIDSGIDMNHPEFAGRIFGGKDLIRNDLVPDDELGHGTHVSGTIGAIGNNGVGIAGMNWNIKIMPFKICKADRKCIDSSSSIIEAANNGAKVINMSIGTEAPNVQPCSQVPTLQQAINYAVSKGVVVVVAAGNDNRDASNVSPASCDNVMTVGATDESDNRSIWSPTKASNFGNNVIIAAPGTNIYSTYPVANGGYAPANGTSMASPHVAGAAALLLATNPSLSPQQVKDCLVNNADSISTDQKIGNKRLNVLKTLQNCASIAPITPTISPSPAPTTTTTPSPLISISPIPSPTTAIVPPVTPPSTGTGTDPTIYYSCHYDPVCAAGNNKAIQICPLICDVSP